MLDASYKNREQGIEEVVYNFLKDCEPAPMSNDVSELFLKLAIAGNDFKIPQNEKPFLYQLIEKRVKHSFTFKFTDDRAILTLVLWAESAGNAILYLWYIQGWCFKNNVREVDFETLGSKIFHMGIFSEKDLKSAWDNKKVKHTNMGSDNLVDYNLSGLSIQFLD
jgi:hypothetical protein